MKSFTRILIKLPILAVLFLLGSVALGKKNTWGSPHSNKTPLPNIVSEMSLVEALNIIPPKYGVPAQVVSVLIEKESGGDMAAIRFEPSQIKHAEKYSKNKDLQRMYASSHCALQIMGYNAAARGVEWYELYKPETCVEVGMNIWAKCRENRCDKTSSSYDCIKATATCYNGSTKYAADFMRRLGEDVINQNLDIGL